MSQSLSRSDDPPLSKTDRAQDLDFSTIFQWAIVCQEARIKRKKKTWGVEEQAMASGGEETTPSREARLSAVAAVEAAAERRPKTTPKKERFLRREEVVEVEEEGEQPSEEAAAVAAAAATEEASRSAATPAQEGVVSEHLTAMRCAGEGLATEVEAVRGTGAMESTSRDVAAGGNVSEGEIVRGDGDELATGSGGSLGGEMGVSGSGGGVTGVPHTPTVEDLFVAAERAGDEVVIGGRVVATPVLRATTIEPRVGDSGIGASHPVPFTEGDFLDSARPQDILDALGVLLSGAGTAANRGSPEMADLGAEEPEEEMVIEERITAADEAKADLATARPGFESGTYAPRLHLFEPTGMTGYVPARDDYPEDLLLRDRATHISSGWTTRTKDIYGHGGSASSLKYFKELPRRVRELVEEVGFGPFIQLLTSVRVDCASLTALAERWWDTTNTFHLRFGEMTVTPLDFAAITGLRVGGEPIPFDPSIDLDDTALRWFIGRVPRHSGGVAEYG
ncbi:hypothetical protein RHMOL_Rhmol09G0084200 [Rhododendron molle]|uniref:Uncharacterized protein n=1 Tax=Rhododendron molle TaxID=49168 RepID=A0ACC0MBH8_RHOML|nr:hypothetical protein RHMOL_Rhmol09G0084200 [Rhododendron molle]